MSTDRIVLLQAIEDAHLRQLRALDGLHRVVQVGLTMVLVVCATIAALLLGILVAVR